MKQYKVKLETEFSILAENENEALEIANEQVKQIRRDYCFDLNLSVVLELEVGR